MSDSEGPKRQVAARVSPDIAGEIDRLQSEEDCSQSEAVRVLLRRGIEHERLQRERDSLQNRLNTLAGREREHAELVEYVEREKSMQERREERERKREQRRNAPAWRRAKWWLLGRAEAEA